ncbi:MAG: two-component system sensor histidine kinase CreC [Myxococcales bacterium]|nr:two-component system sensor histidine kinase CreC [Myxococcales bacterium]
MSIRLKVALLLLGLYSSAGIAGYLVLKKSIRPQFLRVMEDAMVDHVGFLSQMIALDLPDDPSPDQLAPALLARTMKRLNATTVDVAIYEVLKQRLDFRVYITDRKGIVRYDSDAGRDLGKDYSRWHDVYLALQGRYGSRSSIELDSQKQLRHAMYVGFPLRKNGRVVGSVTVVKPYASLSPWVARAEARLWTVYALGALLLYLLSLFLSQLVLRPIMRLTRFARGVASGQRLPAPRAANDEIGELTRAFVAMKDALSQRRDVEGFVTQLTHELKSPLSAISGAAELLDDPQMPADARARFLANISEQASRMDHIIMRLLKLVSLEQQEELANRQPIAVESLVEDLDARYQPTMRQRQLRWRTAIASGAPEVIVGDRFLIDQALDNLVQNAIEFVAPGGEITLELAAEAGWVAFRVTDDGPGIPSYALPHVKRRFYSLEHPQSRRKGTGLGLPFVEQVALLHGGEFRIDNRPSGGVLAELRLPTAETRRRSGPGRAAQTARGIDER